MIATLKECTTYHEAQFVNKERRVEGLPEIKHLLKKSRSQSDLERPQDLNRTWHKKLEKSLDNYQREVNCVESLLDQLKHYFQYLLNNYESEREQLMALTNLSNSFFAEKESLNEQLQQLMAIF